jgi:glutaredoxin
MYVKPECPYCQAAREGLSEQGVEFEERDATTRDDWKQELFDVSPRGIVPTVVGPEGVAVGWEGSG